MLLMLVQPAEVISEVQVPSMTDLVEYVDVRQLHPVRVDTAW